MICTVTLTAIAALAPAAPVDAPDRLITAHGVELRADENVFLLFAALNAAGYSEETNRKGPPLRAPVFHEIRVDVREQLREAAKAPSMSAVRKVFEANPNEIEAYLSAVLEARTKSNLASAVLPVLNTFRTESKLTKVFDKVAEDQRDHAQELKVLLEKDFKLAQTLLGAPNLRAPKHLVVVPNPLDGHAMVRSLKIGDQNFLVVGPGSDTARAAILKLALRPAVAEMVKAAYPRAKGFRRSWDGLKTSRRIAQRYIDGENYLTEALAETITHRLALLSAGTKDTREADEDFIDEQARKGMRWARATLRLLDKKEAGSPLSEQLPKLVSKLSP